MVRRSTVVGQGRDAGEDTALEELEAGAAAGAHEGDLVAEAGFVQGLDAVAAADDALGAVFLGGIHDGLGHGKSADSEARVFKYAHGAVPQDGFGLLDKIGVSFGGGGPDVHAFLGIGDIGFSVDAGIGQVDYGLALLVQFIGLYRGGHHVVRGQKELDVARFGLIEG